MSLHRDERIDGMTGKPVWNTCALQPERTSVSEWVKGAAHYMLDDPVNMGDLIEEQGLRRGKRMCVDDMDFTKPLLKKFTGQVMAVVEDKYALESPPNVADNVARAMYMPMDGAIRHPGVLEINQKVLILNPGREREARSIEARLGTMSSLEIDVVCADKAHVDRSIQRFNSARKLNVILGRADSLLDKKLFRNKRYDLIICHQTLQEFLSNEKKRQDFVEFLHAHLHPTGRMIATMYDYDSLKHVMMAQAANSDWHMKMGVEYPKCNENDYGAIELWQGKYHYIDPLVPMEVVQKAFLGADLVSSVYGARYLFREKVEACDRIPQFPILPWARELIYRPELQIQTLVVVRLSTARERITEIKSGVGYKKVPWTWAEAKAKDARSPPPYYSHNKGRPLTCQDLIYYASNLVALGPKWNGVMGVMWTTDDNQICIRLDDGRSYSCPVGPMEATRFTVQIEYLGDIGPVVVDAYDVQGIQYGRFIDRWLAFRRLYEARPWLSMLCRLTPFVIRPNIEAYREVHAHVRSNPIHYDGITIQPLVSPPGHIIKHGAGSARYLKDVYTVDCLIGSGVYECLWDHLTHQPLEKLRYRPDKKIPNSKEEIQRLEQALSPRQYFDFFEATVERAVTMKDLPVIVDYLKKGEIPSEAYAAIPRHETMLLLLTLGIGSSVHTELYSKGGPRLVHRFRQFATRMISGLQRKLDELKQDYGEPWKVISRDDLSASMLAAEIHKGTPHEMKDYVLN